MSYRANMTDKQQDVLEAAAYENGIPVQEDQKTRVIIKAEGGTERVAHATPANHIGSNAGVVMPHDDVPGRFLAEQQGKA
jgi:hypothetical protein